MNKRERERERERERDRETISVTFHTGTAMLCRWPFHQPASRLRLALTRVVDRQGQLVYEYCKSSHWQVEFMLCAICRSTFTRQFFRVLTPGPSSLDFSRESPAKLVSLIGESMSWNFPAKIKNSLRPIPSFEMMSKFPGWDHSCRRRYVNKLFGGKKE